MYVNPGVRPGIVPLLPQGTNSTLFTECCKVAICDDEQRCPVCKREIVGADAKTAAERGRIRWKNATRHWVRKAEGRVPQ